MKTNDEPIQMVHPPDTPAPNPYGARSRSLSANVATAPPDEPLQPPRADGSATAGRPSSTPQSLGTSSPDLVSALDLVAHRFKAAVLAEVLTPNLLSWTEFQILRIVASQPEIRSIQAANRAGMNRATLSGVVDRLTQRGLLVRLECLEGGRQVLLRLTDAGSELWQQVADQVDDTERRYVGRTAGRRLLVALNRRITIELDRS